MILSAMRIDQGKTNWIYLTKWDTIKHYGTDRRTHVTEKHFTDCWSIASSFDHHTIAAAEPTRISAPAPVPRENKIVRVDSYYRFCDKFLTISRQTTYQSLHQSIQPPKCVYAYTGAVHPHDVAIEDSPLAHPIRDSIAAHEPIPERARPPKK